MGYKAFSVSIFGRDHLFDWEFESNRVTKALEALKKEITEPAILDGLGGHVLTFNNYELACEGLYSNDVLDYVQSKTDTYQKPMGTMKWLLQISEEDKEWGEWRNREFTTACYYKITLPDWFVNMVTQECDRLISEIQEKTALSVLEQDMAKKAEKLEKDQLLKDVKVSIKEKTITDEGGKTKEYTYDIFYNGNHYQLCDRNVFDFGRVINYQDGILGMQDGRYVLERFSENSGGWKKYPLSLDEQHVAKVVYKYGVYAKSSIRMDAHKDSYEADR